MAASGDVFETEQSSDEELEVRAILAATAVIFGKNGQKIG